MKLLQSIRKALRKSQSGISMDQLINYPKDTLGFHLGSFLFNNSYEADPMAQQEDVYRLLIMKEASNKEEIAMHYYLFGNGDLRLRTLFIIATGAVFFPHCLIYFYSKYRDGKNALRFYDLDYFRMLHLPLNKIKDAFMIR